MASSNRNLELARQVIEFGIPRQHLRSLQHQRRRIDDLARVNSRNRAAGNVAYHVPAGSRGVKTDFPEAVENVGKSFDRDPVQLKILTDSEIGDSIGVATGEVGNRSQLNGSHHPVRDADAHHETLEGAADSTLSSGYTGSVALGIHAPPAEVSADPFGRNGSESFARKAADLFQTLPRVLRALEAFDSLRRGLFCSCLGCRHKLFFGQ